jgi:SAM-dependent methyltransferase
MLHKIRSAFFAMKPARQSLARIRTPHYAARGALIDRRPPPLEDLPVEDVVRINRKSDEYYDDAASVDTWIDKPLSDLQGGADSLWRFGLLLSALRIGPTDRVLDFGCGTGWTSAMLARTGAEITGTDISERALAIAREAAARTPTSTGAGHLRFLPFTGTRIDVPDGHFDFVLVFDALHHLPNPVTVLRECARVLGPHGYLGFAEPGLGHSHSYTAVSESAHGVLEGEVDPEQLRATARAAGFEELELIVPPVPPNILTLPMPRARWYLRGVPWIVPHDYIRAAILTSPIGILRKGPYISTSLHPHTLHASIRALEPRLAVRCGERFVLRAIVRNPTGTVWLQQGRRDDGGVRLGARLLRLPGTEVAAEWKGSGLPRDMRQDDDATLEVECQAPGEAGEYLLRLDMVAEGLAWFHERGSQPVDLRLRVSA